MNNEKEFKPYIPADKVLPELTPVSIILGILLAVVFGGANAYLGLRVGMTVSASIPAAVISMGIIRVILRRDSILENNMVQTIGSAGESLAAGAIFTLPALFMWAEEGGTSMPSLVEIALIALIGGVIGVMFMIPLRSALIVQEHGKASLSGRKSLCRSTGSRRRRRSKSKYRICRSGNCSSIQIHHRWFESIPE